MVAYLANVYSVEQASHKSTDPPDQANFQVYDPNRQKLHRQFWPEFQRNLNNKVESFFNTTLREDSILQGTTDRNDNSKAHITPDNLFENSVPLADGPGLE